jgi:serine/threonine-protein kinase RsbW
MTLALGVLLIVLVVVAIATLGVLIWALLRAVDTLGSVKRFTDDSDRTFIPLAGKVDATLDLVNAEVLRIDAISDQVSEIVERFNATTRAAETTVEGAVGGASRIGRAVASVFRNSSTRKPAAPDAEAPYEQPPASEAGVAWTETGSADPGVSQADPETAEPTLGDHVRLTCPARDEFARMVRMTAAALAGRMGMSIDEVDDVRMAVEEAFLLAKTRVAADELVTFDFEVDDDRLALCVGPLAGDAATGAQSAEARYARFILESVCDEFSFDDAPDDSTCTLRLTKKAAR